MRARANLSFLLAFLLVPEFHLGTIYATEDQLGAISETVNLRKVTL